MQIFQNKQHSLPSGNNVVQVHNVSSESVRIGHSGLYLGSNEYAVGENNTFIERAVRNGFLLVITTESRTTSKNEKYGKKAKKVEEAVESAEVPEPSEVQELANISSEEEQLVATETDYL